MKLDLKLLKNIAEEVRRGVQPLAGRVEAGRVVGIGAGGDLTKHIDAVAEEIVLNMLKTYEVPCTVVSEEKGVVEILGGNSNVYLIVDSLDGTTNALRNIPFYTTSLAVAGIPKLSAIHTSLVADLPSGKIFSAEKGKGAWLDGEALKPSKTQLVEEAVLTINISANTGMVEKFGRLISKTRHIRHFGANSLEICYVASGRLDAHIDFRRKLRVTDVAGAYLILKEAGGFIIGEDGRDLDSPAEHPSIRLSLLAAANMELMENLTKLIP